jgi:putative endonuclease
MASRSRTLYIGVTTHLERRVAEHQRHLVPGFTSRYWIERLVCFEVWGRQIKGWLRSKKITLVESKNPAWADLAAGWYGKADSSPRCAGSE